MNVPSTEERIKNLLEAQKEALAAHKLANQVMRDQFTPKGHTFDKGEKCGWMHVSCNISDQRNLHYAKKAPLSFPM